MERESQKIAEAGREGVENVLHTADTMVKTAAECAEVCSGNVSACIASGDAAARVFREIGNEIIETTNRTFSDYLAFSKEAIECRTVNDVIELQNRMFQQRLHHYFSEVSRLYNLLFDGYTQAIEPLEENMDIASEQIRKAMAA